MTYEAYLALFPSAYEATVHENACLSIASEFLPQFVRDQQVGDAEPNEAYWDWLASQLHQDPDAEEDERRTRVVTMTDHPPVKIYEDEWPRIAKASWYNNQPASAASRECHLHVRRHADGRHLVYGIKTTQFEKEVDLRGGELVAATDGSNLIAAIHRVADTIEARDHLVAELIANLPPVEL